MVMEKLYNILIKFGKKVWDEDDNEKKGEKIFIVDIKNADFSNRLNQCTKSGYVIFRVVDEKLSLIEVSAYEHFVLLHSFYKMTDRSIMTLDSACQMVLDNLDKII